MLSLWRRHTKDCKHRKEGRRFTKCSCPVWCDGEVAGRRVRKSLDTRNWARAGRKAATLENSVESGRARKPIDQAASAFLAQCSVEGSTSKKYTRWLTCLAGFACEKCLKYMDELNQLEFLDQYRLGRKVGVRTWRTELQLLRTFFTFSIERKWTDANPAKVMKMPPEPKAAERIPYTSAKVTRIIAACGSFGRHAYERLRARAMVLMQRFYGLRVSDVATLERDRIRNGEIFLHTLKNGKDLWLPLFPEVQRALECVPSPIGATSDCKYFFWNGRGDREGHIKTVHATLAAVLRESGVKNAHPHRFRHTLATEILVKGGTIEDAANILGDSPAIIRKYYAKWSVAYQARTVEIMRRVHGTSVAHAENEFGSPLFSADRMVLEVGVEPTCPVKGAGF